MKKVLFALIACFALLASMGAAQQPAPTPAPTSKPADASPHTAQRIEVEKDVKLEVLDWGGKGRTLVLLAGLGFTAHDFDTVAPKLATRYRVLGITRRGFAPSSIPEPDASNYSATRLANDVLAVMDALKLDHPVLAGHSLAGEELTWIGVHHPERVAGLIYLDAAYPYAYFNDKADSGDPTMDIAELRAQLDRVLTPMAISETRRIVHHLAEVSLPRVERDLEQGLKDLANIPDSPSAPRLSSTDLAVAAIRRGVEVQGGVQCPVLAIYALPHHFPPQMTGGNAEKLKEMVARDKERNSVQADAFQAANPQARVVRIADADHFIYKSNEAEVLKEMDDFMARLQ
jgi:pimeloyl-ACP methyl ester carboxylesterase